MASVSKLPASDRARLAYKGSLGLEKTTALDAAPACSVIELTARAKAKPPLDLFLGHPALAGQPGHDFFFNGRSERGGHLAGRWESRPWWWSCLLASQIGPLAVRALGARIVEIHRASTVAAPIAAVGDDSIKHCRKAGIRWACIPGRLNPGHWVRSLEQNSTLEFYTLPQRIPHLPDLR